MGQTILTAETSTKSDSHGIQSSPKVTCLSPKNNVKNTDNIKMCMQPYCLAQGYASSTKETYIVSSRVCQLFYDNDNENAPRVQNLHQEIGDTAGSCKNAHIGQFRYNIWPTFKMPKNGRSREGSSMLEERLQSRGHFGTSCLCCHFCTELLTNCSHGFAHVKIPMQQGTFKILQPANSAAERCESFLSYTNTGYNMEKIHPA